MKIGNHDIGLGCPTYFVADIGSNHDGSLDKACRLIELAKRAGADAVKFQHFRAEHIVSGSGFAALPKMAHQADWTDSVVDTYRKASIPWDWTPVLAGVCQENNVTFLSTPYDLEAVEHLNPYVTAWKIGSGDITYRALIEAVAKTGKPVMLSTGASTLGEVVDAMTLLRDLGNGEIVLMQCNTNYTGDPSNIYYTNLNVLKAYATLYPDAVLGFSDHSYYGVAVIGAVALGARVIEKHFTYDRKAVGPDHSFAMDHKAWWFMVRDVREMEELLGSPVKRVALNERESRIVQRRAWYGVGDEMRPLRPCPTNSPSALKIND